MSRDILKQWLDRAEDDLTAAKILIESEPLILDIACFHLQQSVEKFLKAYLIYHNLSFEMSHNLEYLGSRCGEKEIEFRSLYFNRLTQYAVRSRYPHDLVAPEAEEV